LTASSTSIERYTTRCPASRARVSASRIAPPQRQDAVVLRERRAHRALLDGAEGGLALVDEDVGDGPALGGDDVVVGVPVADPQPLGQQLPHRGLAHAHGADQHDDR
jgi:hypothetical protein